MALIRSRVRRPPVVSTPTIVAAGPRPELTDARLSAAEVARWAELHEAAGVAETVERVLEAVLRVTGGDCSGAILVRRGGLAAVGAVDPRAEEADLLQVDHGEGPSVPLADLDGCVMIPDTATEQRWPRWSRQIAELGLRSVLTVPLTTKAPMGALTVYAAAPDQFTAGDAAAALLLARHAAVAVTGVQGIADLARAVDARHLIGQAQGLLMERFAIDQDQAFAVLRRYSQNGNTKLRVVAARLVATRRLPDGSADG